MWGTKKIFTFFITQSAYSHKDKKQHLIIVCKLTKKKMGAIISLELLYFSVSYMNFTLFINEVTKEI